MIRNIIYSFIFFDLILAILISLVWVSNSTQFHTIRLGTTLLPFLQQINLEVSQSTFEIPYFNEVDYVTALNVGIWYWVNLFIFLYNGLLGVINFGIYLTNSMIQVLNFFRLLFVNIKSLGDTLASL